MALIAVDYTLHCTCTTQAQYTISETQGTDKECTGILLG